MSERKRAERWEGMWGSRWRPGGGGKTVRQLSLYLCHGEVVMRAVLTSTWTPDVWLARPVREGRGERRGGGRSGSSALHPAEPCLALLDLSEAQVLTLEAALEVALEAALEVVSSLGHVRVWDGGDRQSGKGSFCSPWTVLAWTAAQSWTVVQSQSCWWHAEDCPSALKALLGALLAPPRNAARHPPWHLAARDTG